ncbi:helix-turn-helix domain-containing protein [Streptomyces sp. MCA2]|nr:helix-turn-helix domain-containing protein [Streptomyces sp. MCA2]MCL7495046.1 helix-turn-helix domain-containing protein [Streptomyces sp. MCA2]
MPSARSARARDERRSQAGSTSATSADRVQVGAASPPSPSVPGSAPSPTCSAGSSPRSKAGSWRPRGPHRLRELLLDARLARARELLESGDLTVEAVARHCGLGTPADFRNLFKAHAGVPPSVCRETFVG